LGASGLSVVERFGKVPQPARITTEAGPETGGTRSWKFGGKWRLEINRHRTLGKEETTAGVLDQIID
jgi:hypothetical protein